MTERGNLIVNALFDQFSYRYFPPGLRWLGHQMLRSMALPSTLKAHGIPPAHPLAQVLIPRSLGCVAWIAKTLLPDPRISYMEQRSSMPAENRKKLRNRINVLDEQFPSYFIGRHAEDQAWAGCPYHAALKCTWTIRPRRSGEGS
ncbi:hypothetical protein ACFQZO_17860 [Bradyrhizobium sp. GCM10027634]|uniref:hypothetical protein n=1 Tax=Bradyrhizobium TaxID=374 RepID=UPI0010086B47|nr:MULTISPECIES: hypothetical protein [Bradyrhizobium]MDN5002698.1 hypothetical protein [Bradyrhizobium sp. WYCCWR 12677]